MTEHKGNVMLQYLLLCRNLSSVLKVKNRAIKFKSQLCNFNVKTVYMYCQ